MGVYLRAKFEVSSMILTSFRQWREGGGGCLTPSRTSKWTPKKPTQIRVKLEITFPNILITVGSGRPAKSKLEPFVVIALYWKSLTFFAESSILDRRWYAIYILHFLVKYDFSATV